MTQKQFLAFAMRVGFAAALMLTQLLASAGVSYADDTWGNLAAGGTPPGQAQYVCEFPNGRAGWWYVSQADAEAGHNNDGCNVRAVGSAPPAAAPIASGSLCPPPGQPTCGAPAPSVATAGNPPVVQCSSGCGGPPPAGTSCSGAPRHYGQGTVPSGYFVIERHVINRAAVQLWLRMPLDSPLPLGATDDGALVVSATFVCTGPGAGQIWGSIMEDVCDVEVANTPVRVLGRPAPVQMMNFSCN